MTKQILIMTGSPKANKAVDLLLHAAGLAWVDGGSLRPTTYKIASARLVTLKGVKCVTGNTDTGNDYFAVDCVMYQYHHLTSELVATFPGAKQLPPLGPFHYKGVEYAVDGSEKRAPKQDEHYLYEYPGEGIPTPPSILQCCQQERPHWILKPVISPEIRVAEEQLKTIEDAAVAAREALAKLKAK